MNNHIYQQHFERGRSLAGHFFATFLRCLNCQQVHDIQDKKHEDELIFGFNSDHPHLLSMVSALLPEYKCHQENGHYILRVKKNVIEAQWSYYFRKGLGPIIDQCPLLNLYGDYSDNDHRGNKYAFLLTYSLPNRLEMSLLNQLSTIGLGFREESYIAPDQVPIAIEFHVASGILGATWDDVWSVYQPHVEKLIAIDDFDKFIRTQVIPDIQKNALDKIKQEGAKFFLNGTRPRSKHAHQIFQYYDIEKKEAKGPPIAGPTELADEKELILTIENRINILEHEANSLFYFNEDLKKQKIKFLCLVLCYKEANPHFSLKTCLQFAIVDEPALYQQAIRGRLSTVTRDLFKNILNRTAQNETSGRYVRPGHRY